MTKRHPVLGKASSFLCAIILITAQTPAGAADTAEGVMAKVQREVDRLLIIQHPAGYPRKKAAYDADRSKLLEYRNRYMRAMADNKISKSELQGLVQITSKLATISGPLRQYHDAAMAIIRNTRQ